MSGGNPNHLSNSVSQGSRYRSTFVSASSASADPTMDREGSSTLTFKPAPTPSSNAANNAKERIQPRPLPRADGFFPMSGVLRQGTVVLNDNEEDYDMVDAPEQDRRQTLVSFVRQYCQKHVGLKNVFRRPSDYLRRRRISGILVRQRWRIFIGCFIISLIMLSAASLMDCDNDASGGRARHRAALENRSKRFHAASRVRSGRQRLGGPSLNVDDSDDGMLVVENKDWKKHPIKLIIDGARDAWESKLLRQSRSLKEAVAEYHRRYNCAPPNGFQHWWTYVVENSVRLPDEYDEIHRSLGLYRGFPPDFIAQQIEVARGLKDTFVISSRDGKLKTTLNFDTVAHPGGKQRADAQMSLLRPVSRWIGDFEAVWSVHDTGRILHSRDAVSQVESAVRGGTYVQEYQADTEYGWLSTCAPGSRKKTQSGQSATKSFIRDHYRAMNLCKRISDIDIHGATAGRNPSTNSFVPLFSISRNSLQSDILGVPYNHTFNYPSEPWETRPHTRLLWRGSATGGHYGEAFPWRQTHRFRLVDLYRATRAIEVVGFEDVHSIGLLAKRYLDVALTGKPIQCEETDGTCGAIAREYAFAPRLSHASASEYKFVMDVDGNAWSARFRGLLSAEYVILKSTVMPEWWTDRIQPWVHYVPVQVDYSDLFDIMAFFSEDARGSQGAAAAGKIIAEAGREWVQNFWRPEDEIAYTFRLYLEWVRLSRKDRENAGYVYDPQHEV